MKQLKKIENLTEQAFERIREGIVNNALTPGKLYSASEIGSWLGVSRTPIREAAQQLANIGLVRIEKNRGIRILPTSFKRLIESFQIRLMLEVPVISHVAAIRTTNDLELIQKSYKDFHKAAKTNDPIKTLEADKEYHLCLLKTADITHVITIIENTRNTVLLTGPSTIPTSRSPMEAFLDHAALHQAIVDQDASKAASEMRRHIIHTAELLIKQESPSRDDWHIDNLLSHLNWIHY